MADISRKNFKRASELIKKHPSFFEGVKEKAINDLLDRCETEDKYQLMDELIGQFYLMEHDIYGLILTDLAKHIVSKGYPANETALLALAHDSRPDSSETVIRDLYMPLYKENYPDLHQLETRNKFGKLHELFKAGRKHFFVVDEFLGSGKTAKIAYKDFLNETKGNATLEFIYVAGMKEGFDNLKSAGASYYCPWVMTKAISDKYPAEDVQDKKDTMLSIETTLATVINKVKLSDNSMGYGDAQAVYCMRNSNIPNSTFPVFWWYKDVVGKDISTIFFRMQDGF